MMLTPKQWDTLKNHPDFHGDCAYKMLDAEDAAGLSDEIMDEAERLARTYGDGKFSERLRQAYRTLAPYEDNVLQLDARKAGDAPLVSRLDLAA